jgi:hypothetical protein
VSTKASRTPRDQSFYVKQGRFIDFGFEPCANAFFDFYLTPKYIDPPLLELEDVGFFLFLRKNVNPKNPSWKMPSIRQMMRRLGISQRKLDAMMKRLIQAGLLEKVSGYQAGEDGENVPNHYLLSDPIPTLQEFLITTAEGKFGVELKEYWREYITEQDPVREMHTGGVRENDTPVREADTDPVRESHTIYKQTSSIKQGNELDQIWDSVLESLRAQMPFSSFVSFVEDTQLVAMDSGCATIALGNPAARDWVENRLARNIKSLLNIELRIANREEKITELRIVKLSTDSISE